MSEKKQTALIQYVPMGQTAEISLTVGRTKQYLCVPTKSGVWPTDEDVMKFMMLCKSRELNPWEGDAHLVGFDSRDGAKFSLITGVGAFLKRSECHPQFDGMEHGVMLLKDDGEIECRQGDFYLDNERLIGGWCTVYRKDRHFPERARVKLSVYSSGRSRWNIDPGGMIAKCAIVAGLRRAFPMRMGGLYVQEEMESTAYQPEGTTQFAAETLSDLTSVSAATAGRVEVLESPAPEPAPAPKKKATRRKKRAEPKPKPEPKQEEAPAPEPPPVPEPPLPQEEPELPFDEPPEDVGVKVPEMPDPYPKVYPDWLKAFVEENYDQAPDVSGFVVNGELDELEVLGKLRDHLSGATTKDRVWKVHDSVMVKLKGDAARDIASLMVTIRDEEM